MRRLTTLFFILLVCSMATWAQYVDTVRHVIISEVRWDGWEGCYVEFTNMGDSAVHLDQFIYGNVRGAIAFIKEGDVVDFEDPTFNFSEDRKYMRLTGVLEPGASTIFAFWRDPRNRVTGRTRNPIGLIPYATMFNHGGDGNYITNPNLNKDWYFPYEPENQLWGFDSITRHEDGLVLNHRTSEAGALIWSPNDTLNVLVDQVFLDIDWDGDRKNKASDAMTVAGVPECRPGYNFVRKFNVKEGETDWTKAVGVDATTSQWMLYPHREDNDPMRRTCQGNHGDYSIDVSSKGAMTLGTGTITVPWGTHKHDSVINGLNVGDGMAWWYLLNDDFQDSLSTICKTGDTLVLYAFGDDLEIGKYAVTVSAPANDMKNVYARHPIVYPDPEDEDYVPGMVAVAGTATPYLVKEYTDVIDSIVDIPYAVKVDTFLNLLEKAANATWEIVTPTGDPTNEIRTGDKLKVTAQDGSSKEYYLKTDAYVMSNNTHLASITWPDNPYPFLEGWKQDTIPGFIPAGTSYKIMLPPMQKTVPALIAKTEDLNATVSVQRAISLSGGHAERTTIFTVTSESDTMFQEISVTFEVEDPYKQLYIGDPIFSKFYMRFYWGSGIMEMVNPSDELIDLSNYMIVRSAETNPGDAIGDWAADDSTTWLRRYMKYVPGYKWAGSYDDWKLEPQLLELDVNVKSLLDPGDVWVGWHPHQKYNQANMEDYMPQRTDLRIMTDDYDPGVYDNPWNEPIEIRMNMAYPLFPNEIFYLFKIVGDSVKSGEKPATDAADFELVDAFGYATTPWMLPDINTGDSVEVTNGTRRYVRVPSSYKGAKVLGEGMFANWPQDSPIKSDRASYAYVFGQHTLDPVTEQISTVASLSYIVDKGFEGDLDILGVSGGETVALFYGNLIQPDTSQMLSVLSGSDGAERADGDAVANGDTLKVVSANGVNTTRYVISTGALSSDTDLAHKFLGVVLEVDIPGAKISNFMFGGTIKAILDSLQGPADALINVVNAADELVPLMKVNNDTDYVEVVATKDHFIEVIAQDGTVKKYQLVPNSSNSDAYVVSDLYTVTEEPVRIISGLVGGTAISAFNANIFPAEGAVTKVFTVTGQERTLGNISVDDILEVKSADGSVSVTYQLQFLEEQSVYVSSSIYMVDQEGMLITAPENTTVEALLGGLTAAPHALMTIVDADLNGKTTGTLLATDKVMVVSEDGMNSAYYELELTELLLAYVTSDAFTVDQDGLTITVPENTPVDSLIAGLAPAPQAVVTLKDADGNDKTTGNVIGTDKIEVVSGDGENTATYSIDILLSTGNNLADLLRVYPNPAQDILHVENLPAGSNIRVTDITGRTVSLIEVSEATISMDLSGMEKGLYMLSVEKDASKLATLRFIKK